MTKARYDQQIPGSKPPMSALPPTAEQSIAMARKNRNRRTKASRCSCCRPGRFIDVRETIKGKQYTHSDDGTPATKQENS